MPSWKESFGAGVAIVTFVPDADQLHRGQPPQCNNANTGTGGSSPWPRSLSARKKKLRLRRHQISVLASPKLRPAENSGEMRSFACAAVGISEPLRRLLAP